MFKVQLKSLNMASKGLLCKRCVAPTLRRVLELHPATEAAQRTKEADVATLEAAVEQTGIGPQLDLDEVVDRELALMNLRAPGLTIEQKHAMLRSAAFEKLADTTLASRREKFLSKDQLFSVRNASNKSFGSLAAFTRPGPAVTAAEVLQEDSDENTSQLLSVTGGFSTEEGRRESASFEDSVVFDQVAEKWKQAEAASSSPSAGEKSAGAAEGLNRARLAVTFGAQACF